MKFRQNLLALACVILALGFALPPVTGYTIIPLIFTDSDTRSDTPVTVSYKIQFDTQDSSRKETFPSSDELILDTDLEDAVWTWELVLDGVESPRPLTLGISLSLTGFELSDPNRIDEFILVRLDGTAPKVLTTETKNMLRIREINTDGHVIRESLYRQSVSPG